MLYETAARASQVLALDMEDLDRPRRRARVRSEDGSTDMILWAAPTAAAEFRRYSGGWTLHSSLTDLAESRA